MKDHDEFVLEVQGLSILVTGDTLLHVVLEAYRFGIEVIKPFVGV